MSLNALKAEKIVLRFDDVVKMRTGGVEYSDICSQLQRVFSEASLIEAPIKGGAVFISRSIGGSGNVSLNVFDRPDPEDRSYIGKATVDVDEVEGVSFTDIRLTADFYDAYIGKGVGTALYNTIDRALEPLGVKVVPSTTPLKPGGEALWKRRDPQALAVLEAFKYLKHELKNGASDPEYIVTLAEPELWDAAVSFFSAPA